MSLHAFRCPSDPSATAILTHFRCRSALLIEMLLQMCVSRMHLGMNNLEYVAPVMGEPAVKMILLIFASRACIDVGVEVLVRTTNAGEHDMALQAHKALAGSVEVLWKSYWSNASFGDLHEELQTCCFQLDWISRRGLLPVSDADDAKSDAASPPQWQ